MVQLNGNTASPNGANGADYAARLVVARPRSSGGQDEPRVKPVMLLNAIRRCWYIALPTGLVLAAIGAAGGWLYMVPTYRAAAYLQVDSTGERPPTTLTLGADTVSSRTPRCS